MKILIYATAFHPSVGGYETALATLAREFIRLGHEVKLVSRTPGTGEEAFPFEVIRQPGPIRLLGLLSWCDIFLQGNVSLKAIWPLLLYRKPFSVTHQGFYAGPGKETDLRVRLKFLATRFAHNISTSQAVAAHVPSPSTVIPNPYQSETFRLMPAVARDKGLVFLGRLVSDKGADLVLEALAKLKERGLKPQFTIIGTGPEETALRELAGKLLIGEQVSFLGTRFGRELAEVLNAHHILVMPSRGQEGFPVVILEGIACGCVVVGSNITSVEEAIGPCGTTFPSEDIAALTDTLAALLTDQNKLATYRAQADNYLPNHKGEEVARAYLNVFQQALQS